MKKNVVIVIATLPIRGLPMGMDPLTRSQAAKALYGLDRLRRASSGIFGFFR